MKRLVSILFLSLLLLQAIPVLHFFSEEKAVFYSLIDEEKPVEKWGLEKKEGKEYLSAFQVPLVTEVTNRCFPSFRLSLYSSPTLDALTPPPNACC